MYEVNLIITHVNGDFDALAALVAATKLYPGTTALMPEPLQPNVRAFINLYRDLLPLSDPKDLDQKLNSLIVVDTNRKERLGKWASLLDQAGHITVYDHHPGEEDLGADSARIEPVGATTTILLEDIIKRKLPLTEFEATLFTLGIYEDTGCLTYEISTARDAKAVAYLWENGLSTKLIQEYLRSPLTDVQKELLEKLLHNSEFYELNQRRVLISTTILDEYVDGAAVILQLLDEIEDASLTVIIIQMTDSIYLAARSKDEDVDLVELLAPFNVKGYPGVVSAHFKGVEVEEVREQVVEFLKYYLPPAVTAEKAASKPVLTVKSETTLEEADQLLSEHSFKGAPVTEDGRLVGIISRRDLHKGLRSSLGHAPVKGFMSRKLITAAPEQSLTELRRLMVEENIGRIPLVDSNGALVGIVTRSDILRYLSSLDRRGRSLKQKLSQVAGTESTSETESGYFDQEKDVNILPLIQSEMPARIQKLLLRVRSLAERQNIKIYLVGGMIRDLLLKYPLEKDLDFVVLGDAVDFARNLNKLLAGSMKHFEQFGTASIELEDGFRLDLVTARKEFYLSPAALPSVESSSLKNDLFRRDFTINTMACSLVGDNYGELYDYFNGRCDLQSKIIRALYQLSFVDDPLRILRAVRFEQRYAFTIEPNTLERIEKAIEQKVLEKVSRQRLNRELRFIYNEPSPVNILRRFDQLGLMPYLYPRTNPGQQIWQLLFELENVLDWAYNREWEKKPDKELTYLSGLFCGLESADLSVIISKLNLSQERASIIFQACREVPTVLEKLGREDLNPSTVVRYLEPLPIEALMLAHALTESVAVRDHLKIYMDGLRYIRPRLDGGDLKKMGLEPGPRYRQIIDSLKQAVLDGEVNTPQEELDYVIKYLETEKRKEED